MFEASDNQDRMVALLEQIAANTGGLGDEEIDASGQSTSSVERVNPRRFHVIETTEMESANADGTVTLEPGESAPIVAFRHKPGFALLGVGAKNQQDVEYRLVADDTERIGGDWRAAPLGEIGSPFSFVDQLGVVFDIEEQLELEARLSEDASSTVDLAGKFHIQI